jgi:hypothetical protein
MKRKKAAPAKADIVLHTANCDDNVVVFPGATVRSSEGIELTVTKGTVIPMGSHTCVAHAEELGRFRRWWYRLQYRGARGCWWMVSLPRTLRWWFDDLVLAIRCWWPR